MSYEDKNEDISLDKLDDNKVSFWDRSSKPFNNLIENYYKSYNIGFFQGFIVGVFSTVLFNRIIKK
jgi:hypothetical protein